MPRTKPDARLLLEVCDPGKAPRNLVKDNGVPPMAFLITSPNHGNVLGLKETIEQINGVEAIVVWRGDSLAVVVGYTDYQTAVVIRRRVGRQLAILDCVEHVESA